MLLMPNNYLKKSEIFTFPTEYALFKAQVFILKDGTMPVVVSLNQDHLSLNDILVRIHSECFMSEVLSSIRCDCASQLKESLKRIASEGQGVLFYLRQEGKGMGLFNKAKAYYLQEKYQLSNYEADKMAGFPEDTRDYAFVVEVLNEMNIHSIRLLTNNDEKIRYLKENGINVQKTSLA